MRFKEVGSMILPEKKLPFFAILKIHFFKKVEKLKIQKFIFFKKFEKLKIQKFIFFKKIKKTKKGFMKVEEVSASVANLADKLSKYHSRLLELERELKNIKEVKNGDGKNKTGEQLPKT